MPSPRAQGAFVEFLAAFESAYGTAPDGSGGGIYTKMPMRDNDVGGERALGYDPLLGLGRDSQAPHYEGLNVDGSITVPFDLRYLGFWLKSLFGDPVTTDLGGATKFSHVFTAGGDVLSYTLEVGHPNLTIPDYRHKLGCRSETLSFDMTRTGPANGTIGVVGQNDVDGGGASVDAGPITHAVRRFNQGNGGILIGGAQVGVVTGGRAEFTNSLDRVETIRTDGLIEAADPTEAMITGSIDVRHSVDATLETAGLGQTPVALRYEFTMPGAEGYALQFDMPAVYFPVRKQPISGPGGIQVTYDWRAARDDVAGHMLQATLINDVASY